MSILRVFIKRFISMLLYVFRLFPIKKNQIFLINDLSYSFGDNLKYLCVYLLEHHKQDFEIVYVLKDGAAIEAPYIEQVKTVRPKSFGFFYEAIRSKVLITNSGGISYLPIRKKQIVINTWHGGGAYKMVGVSTRKDTMSSKDTALTAKKTSYMLASSKLFKTFMAQSMMLREDQFIDSGMPRNDLFFQEHAEIVAKVKSYYGIALHKKIVLYAPTFRNQNNDVLAKKITPNYDIDDTAVVQALQEKFGGEFVFAARLHPMIKDDAFTIGPDCYNFGQYPDMQELLYAADVLITDYSSSMWDYSLTKKPCFLYANDIYEYEKVRGFYTPVSSWPFAVALDNAMLQANIANFDNDVYQQKIKKHHTDLGNYEHGKACQIVADLIRSEVR